MGQLADTILVLDSVKDAIVISNNLIKKVDGTKVVYVLKNGEKLPLKWKQDFLQALRPR